MRIVIAGLSITSSWGNGHATTYRSLVAGLEARGHHVLFLERDMPWYAENRDLPDPPYGLTRIYRSLRELDEKWSDAVREADLAVVGSYVPEGVAVGEWALRLARGPVAFYDIDTPVTVAKLRADDEEYLTRRLAARYDLYLSFSGGAVLDTLRLEFGVARPVPFYCSVDPACYRPEERETRWDLGYLGTYSEDRQPAIERLLLQPARAWRAGRFVIAGAGYPPAEDDPPRNVERLGHVAPDLHRAFYASQRWTLNVTRAEMVRAGHSPSVRLFEAAACGVPIVTDDWPGISEIFEPAREIVVARSPADALAAVRDMPEEERRGIARRARARVLASHTSERRAEELERHVASLSGAAPPGVEAAS
jgi:spore maturation protein CgeB